MHYHNFISIFRRFLLLKSNVSIFIMKDNKYIASSGFEGTLLPRRVYNWWRETPARKNVCDVTIEDSAPLKLSVGLQQKHCLPQQSLSPPPPWAPWPMSQTLIPGSQPFLNASNFQNPTLKGSVIRWAWVTSWSGSGQAGCFFIFVHYEICEREQNDKHNVMGWRMTDDLANTRNSWLWYDTMRFAPDTILLFFSLLAWFQTSTSDFPNV
jgi:hypothetical protein